MAIKSLVEALTSLSTAGAVWPGAGVASATARAIRRLVAATRGKTFVGSVLVAGCSGADGGYLSGADWRGWVDVGDGAVDSQRAAWTVYNGHMHVVCPSTRWLVGMPRVVRRRGTGRSIHGGTKGSSRVVVGPGGGDLCLCTRVERGRCWCSGATGARRSRRVVCCGAVTVGERRPGQTGGGPRAGCGAVAAWAWDGRCGAPTWSCHQRLPVRTGRSVMIGVVGSAAAS
jgi:hypothetical protein